MEGTGTITIMYVFHGYKIVMRTETITSFDASVVSRIGLRHVAVNSVQGSAVWRYGMLARVL